MALRQPYPSVSQSVPRSVCQYVRQSVSQSASQSVYLSFLSIPFLQFMVSKYSSFPPYNILVIYTWQECDTRQTLMGILFYVFHKVSYLYKDNLSTWTTFWGAARLLYEHMLIRVCTGSHMVWKHTKNGSTNVRCLYSSGTRPESTGV